MDTSFLRFLSSLYRPFVSSPLSPFVPYFRCCVSLFIIERRRNEEAMLRNEVTCKRRSSTSSLRFFGISFLRSFAHSPLVPSFRNFVPSILGISFLYSFNYRGANKRRNEWTKRRREDMSISRPTLHMTFHNRFSAFLYSGGTTLRVWYCKLKCHRWSEMA